MTTYRWTKVVEKTQEMAPTAVYEVRNVPTSQIRRKLFFLGMWIARKCGVELRLPDKRTVSIVEFKPEDAESIEKALMGKLSERQLLRLCKDKCMIVVGYDEMKTLMQLKDGGMSFVIRIDTQLNSSQPREGYGLVAHFLEIPIYYVPDFVGIAILPDVTGSYVHRIDHLQKGTNGVRNREVI